MIRGETFAGSILMLVDNKNNPYVHMGSKATVWLTVLSGLSGQSLRKDCWRLLVHYGRAFKVKAAQNAIAKPQALALLLAF